MPTTKEVTFVLVESQKERRESVGLKKYLKKERIKVFQT